MCHWQPQIVNDVRYFENSEDESDLFSDIVTDTKQIYDYMNTDLEHEWSQNYYDSADGNDASLESMASIIEVQTYAESPNFKDIHDEAVPDEEDHVQSDHDADCAVQVMDIEAHRITDIPQPLPSMDDGDDSDRAVEFMIFEAHRIADLHFP